MTTAAVVPAAFAAAVERGVLADSTLFVAPSRRRLREAALAAAALVLGRDDPASHPDFVLLDPEALGVDGLRVEHVAHRKDGVPSLEDALRYRPRLGGRRVAVLLDADLMLADAQGALLKTAEEPPPDTHLVLTATDPSALLPALRSRCRLLRLPPLDPEAARGRLAALGLADEEAALLTRAVGSAEAVEDLTDDERAFLLERAPAFARWLAGADPEAGWLAADEAPGRLAEQRRRAILLLQAALGWSLAARPDRPPAEVDPLLEALGDLRGNVTPTLVLGRLRRRLIQTGVRSA